MIHFVTFGDSSYYNSLKRIYNEAKNLNIFDNILIITNKDLENKSPIFWKKHNKFISNNSRGYGYWLWKSFIILKTIQGISENDILVYADSGCTLNKNGLNKMNEYLDIIKKSKNGILSFETTFFEKQYTKRDLFEYLKMNNEVFLNSNHLIATAFILRKCENTTKLVSEWYDTCCIYNLLDDSPSSLKNDELFIEHRHDQSIFSLLRKKYGTEIIPDETFFSNFKSEGIIYPIWATRLK